LYVIFESLKVFQYWHTRWHGREKLNNISGTNRSKQATLCPKTPEAILTVSENTREGTIFRLGGALEESCEACSMVLDAEPGSFELATGLRGPMELTEPRPWSRL